MTAERLNARGYARLLIGQLLWLRDHDEPLPDELAELGAWTVSAEAIEEQLDEVIFGAKLALGELLGQLSEAGVDPGEAMRRAALNLAD